METRKKVAEIQRQLNKNKQALVSAKRRARSEMLLRTIEKVRLSLLKKGIVGVREYPFSVKGKWRFCLAFPDHKLGIDHEMRGSMIANKRSIKEIEMKKQEIKELGWKVIIVDSKNPEILQRKIENYLFNI